MFRKMIGSMKQYIDPLPVCASVLMVLALSGALSFAAAGIVGSGTGDQYTGITQKQDVLAIVTVLEDRIGDDRLLQKAEEKLSTMSGQEIRLMASLCERIPAESITASADVAFLLITVLIILS